MIVVSDRPPLFPVPVLSDLADSTANKCFDLKRLPDVQVFYYISASGVLIFATVDFQVHLV